MSSLESNEVGSCPQCGAVPAGKAKSCWLCHTALEPIAAGAAQPSAVLQSRGAYQFGLSTLMLTVTLFAVLCGVFKMAPGLGVVLAIVVTPALVRTGMAAARKKECGQPMTPSEKVGAFAGSVGVVSVIGIAAGVAFYTTCWVGFFGGAAVSSLWSEQYGPIGWGLMTGGVLGLIVGVYVAYRLIRRLWPRKD